MLCCDKVQQQSQKKSRGVPLVVTDLIGVVEDASVWKDGDDNK
jgi:hypothetical protein